MKTYFAAQLWHVGNLCVASRACLHVLLFRYPLVSHVCSSVSAGKMDDVLDSIRPVQHSRDGHRLAPVMVSEDLDLDMPSKLVTNNELCMTRRLKCSG